MPGMPDPLIAEGVWHGEILKARRGQGGFGYDPVFLDPASGLSGAELTPQQKNDRSHRGQALRSLVEKLKRSFS
jgi:XTP/dITP diphosphohydrolase